MHCVQEEEPSVEYAPATHSTHVFLEVADVHDEKVPDEQFTHCNDIDNPDVDDHVPDAQLTQSDTDVDPTLVEYVPDAQFTHCNDADDPDVDDHVPPTQFTH